MPEKNSTGRRGTRGAPWPWPVPALSGSLDLVAEPVEQRVQFAA